MSTNISFFLYFISGSLHQVVSVSVFAIFISKTFYLKVDSILFDFVVMNLLKILTSVV